MDFSPSSIMAGIIFGLAGWFLFRAAKPRANIYFAVIGAVLMIYPYFVSGPFLMWGIGCALLGVAYFMRNG